MSPLPLLRRLLLVLVVGSLLSATAYAAGAAVQRLDTAAPADTSAQPADGSPAVPAPPASPASPAPSSAAPTPASPSPAAPSPAPLEPGPALLAEGDESDRVRDLQARLAQIGWFSAGVTGYYGPVTVESVRGFQAKREIPVTGEVDRRTLDRLRDMTRVPTAAELEPAASGNTPGPLDARCTTGRVLCVDKTSSTLRWVVDGEVLMTMDARFGAAATPTREGVFSVFAKSRDHVSRLYGSAMPYAMFFSGGQAVHYSSDFAAVGYAGASHGCVNIRDEAAVAALFDLVAVGDRVVVYWS